MVLLIALPHSSSSAARVSLGHMANLYSKQEYPCYLMRPFNSTHIYHAMSLHHHDVCNLNWDTVTRWSLDDSTIYKQHVAPTLENVKLLLLRALYTRRQTGRQIRVVVLTRDPMAALHAACERKLYDERRICGRMPLAERCMRILQDATSANYLAALRDFDSTWKRLAAQHSRMLFILTYEQLLSESRRIGFQRALRWWDIQSNGTFTDAHVLYVNRSSEACRLRMQEVTSGEAEGARLIHTT